MFHGFNSTFKSISKVFDNYVWIVRLYYVISLSRQFTLAIDLITT